MGLTFSVCPAQGVDEQSYFEKDQTIEDSLHQLAIAKAQSVAIQKPESLVLGSDTVVVFEGVALGKPEDYADAFSTLQRLSGSVHQVYSSIALVSVADDITLSAIAMTDVHFRRISDVEIEEYLSIGSYVDKAGSYAIQDEAMTFVERVNGCYNNIVGLPVVSLIELLQDYHSLKGECCE